MDIKLQILKALRKFSHFSPFVHGSAFSFFLLPLSLSYLWRFSLANDILLFISDDHFLFLI